SDLHVNRLVLQRLGDPTTNRPAPQPIVLEQRELLQVVETLDFLERVELVALSLLKPKRRPGRRVEMPLHALNGVGIQGLACLGNSALEIDGAHVSISSLVAGPSERG